MASAEKGIEALNKALRDEAANIKLGREEAQKLALIEEDNRARKDAAAAASRAASSASRDEAAAARELAAALKENAAYQYDIGLGNGGGGIDFAAFMEEKRKAQLKILQDIQGALTGDTAAAFSYDAGLGYSVPVPETTEDTAAPGTGLAAGLSIAAGGVSGLTGMLSAAGPYGMAVAAGIQLVEGIGDGLLLDVASFATGLAETLSNIGDQIAPFIKAMLIDVLPAVASAIPEVISSLLTEVPKALFQVIADPAFWKGLVGAMFDILIGWKVELVKGLAEMLKDFGKILVSPDVWIDIGRSIGNAVRDSVRELLGLGDKDGGGGIRGNITGESRTGTTRQLGEGLGDLMSGRATFSLFRRTNGEQRVGNGVVLGRIADIAENIRRGSNGRGIGFGS